MHSMRETPLANRVDQGCKEVGYVTTQGCIAKQIPINCSYSMLHQVEVWNNK